MNDYPNHPGATARSCGLRINVTGNRSDGAVGGYACSWSGGHCLPSDDCDQRRADANTTAQGE
jgi:hypothetical protein